MVDFFRFSLSKGAQTIDVPFPFADASGPFGIVRMEHIRKEIGSVIEIAFEPLPDGGQSTGNFGKFEIRGRFTPSAGDSIFVNGFQSWTDSRLFSPEEKIRPLSRFAAKMFKLDRFGDYHFYPYTGKRGCFHGYTFTYVRHEDGTIEFIGALDETDGYTIFKWDLPDAGISVVKDVEGSAGFRRRRPLRLFHGEGREGEIWDAYAALLDNPRPPGGMVTGWTSWYYHYTDITEEKILANLKSFGKAWGGAPDKAGHMRVFQIDDGFETAMGDWLSLKSSFPSGMGHLARKIREAGFVPGLWLAPFVCSCWSRVALDHPDWLVRDDTGEPFAAGWNPAWSEGRPFGKGTFYAMDIINDGYRAYMKNVFHVARKDWGFEFFKLDFLYAAGIRPHHGFSRGQIMALGMEFARELAGDARILGCGVPLGSSFGLTEGMRIGSDVALKWEDVKLNLFHYRERVSTVNSLTSTLGRRQPGGRVFMNDPDVFILREKGTALTRSEKYTLFLANNIFGQVILTSDNPDEYGHRERNLYLSMFPVRPKTTRDVIDQGGIKIVFFSIDDFEYTAYLNLSSKPGTVTLPDGWHFESLPWRSDEGTAVRYLKGGSSLTLPPHESACFLKVDPERSAFAGSTGHLFPGCEIHSLSFNVLTPTTGDIQVALDSQALRYGGNTAPPSLLFILPKRETWTVNGLKTRGFDVRGLGDGELGIVRASLD